MLATRPPATSHEELIAVVAELRSEVAHLIDVVGKLDNELKTVTEFKDRSVYVATGVAIGFSSIGAIAKTLWDFLKS
jgi:hypothetical protein